MKRLLLLLVFIGLIYNATTILVQAQEWRTLEGEYFIINYPIGDIKYENDAYKMLEFANFAREVVMTHQPHNPPIKVPVFLWEYAYWRRSVWYCTFQYGTYPEVEIHFLTPSEVPDEYRNGIGDAWYISGMVHEYSHVARWWERYQAGGYSFWDQPSWFDEGLATYLTVFCTTPENLQKSEWALKQIGDMVRVGDGYFLFITGITYYGGGYILKYMYETYGQEKVVNLIRSSAPTFGQALRKELGVTPREFEDRWFGWACKEFNADPGMYPEVLDLAKTLTINTDNIIYNATTILVQAQEWRTLEGEYFIINYPIGDIKYENDAYKMLDFADFARKVVMTHQPHTLLVKVIIFLYDYAHWHDSPGITRCNWWWDPNQPGGYRLEMLFLTPSEVPDEYRFWIDDLWYQANMVHEYSHVILWWDTFQAGGYGDNYPTWFGEGFSEYLKMFCTTPEILQKYEQQLKMVGDKVRVGDGYFLFITGITYYGGTYILKYMYETYGQEKVVNLIRSSAPTFGQALRKELGVTPREFEDRWFGWACKEFNADPGMYPEVLDLYKLTIVASAGGTTDPLPGIHTYDIGTEVSIEATPDENYRFTGWSGDASGTTNPITITMDSNKSITANFIRQYTLTIAAGSGGTTNPVPGTYKHDSGTQVSVKATPDNGYRFTGWSGDVTGTANPLIISVDSDKTITANFIRQYTLAVAAGTGGTTDPAPGSYKYDTGTQVSVKAVSETGYKFGSWTGNVPSGHEKDNTLTITMDSDKSVVANFIRQYTLNVATGTGGTTDPMPGTYTYDVGTSVSVKATPESGYRFSGWTGNVPLGHEKDNPIAITMDSDKSITANFIRQYKLTITAGSGGTTDPVPGTYTYDSGTSVSVKAIPNSGYEFSGWSGAVSGTTNPITINMDSDKSITANFEKSGCFIATAAYGSPLHPHVQILRDFRDKYLMPSKFGREIVDFYYKHSPPIADFIGKHKALKIAVRISLLPLIALSEVLKILC